MSWQDMLLSKYIYPHWNHTFIEIEGWSVDLTERSDAFKIFKSTLRYSFKGTGRKSVVYNAAFSQFARSIRFGKVADIPTIWIDSNASLE